MQVLLNLGRGGMEAMAVGLAVALRRRGRRPVVIALDAGGEHEAVLREAAVEYHVMGGRRLADPRRHWRLARLLRRVRPRVVHTHHFATLLHSLAASRLAGVPRLVHTEHSFEYLKDRPDFRLVLRGMSRATTAFVTVGATMRPFYADRVRIAARRLKVITNGVHLERYRVAADRAAGRAASGLPSGFLVGTAGRLFPEKDYGVLLRAVQAAAGLVPSLALALIGDGPERGPLEVSARQLGIADRVRFLGWRHDVADLLPLLDVFVMTSRHEGLPLVVLEAMASGVPVLTTPVGDLREVVVEGATGGFFHIGDPAALGQALVALAGDEPRRRALGAAGRDRVAGHYSHARMVERYLELYDG